ncbi:MAG: ribosomal protein S18-alanine N-acetyltransferase [bacterium]
MECNDLTVTARQATKSKIPSIIFRKMQLPDLDKVCELESRIFSDPWSRNNFVHEILDNLDSFPFVVEKDKEVIGYAIYWYIDSEAHIANFAIEECFRRKKIGKFLLCRLIEEMKRQKVRVVYLEVRRSNLAAQNLYLKHGFKIIGVRKNYYSKDKEDALLMSLPLKEG